MTINISGVELELDIYDVDVYEKYEHEVNEVSRKVNESPEGQGLSTAESLRYQCCVVNEFFDAVFGPGTSEELFHGKNNIRDTNEAYLTVIKAVSADMGAYTDSVNEEYARMSAKYAPEEDTTPSVQPVAARNAVASQNLNRAQRRNSGKKRKHR